jgi:uncharacterized protein YaeQ
MALPATIYRVNIQLSDIDRNCYESLQTTVARHPSETAERLILRVLAFALCWEPELAFTRGVASGDEPDLWTIGGDGRVLNWIDVGLPDPERLIRASRHVERAVLVASGAALPRWTAQHLAKLEGVANLTVIGFDQEFINRLTERLERMISWSLTITDGSLYLSAHDETIETSLLHLSGPRLA